MFEHAEIEERIEHCDVPAAQLVYGYVVREATVYIAL